MAAAEDPILQAAAEVFGYQDLRPGQREAIQSVVAGRDTLAVMATGSGKSAIFALAGRLLGGTTLVISPLLALQRDQVANMGGGGRLKAVAINSDCSEGERRDLLAGDPPDLVFLAPEQLANSDVLRELVRLRPALMAVDEAHLVSQWGQDFRPDYLRIGAAVESLGHPAILALTATAAPPVRDDIVARLGMRDPTVLVTGFDRPNIELAVHSYFTDEAHKLEVVTNDVVEAARHLGHGIVYGATRKRVENLADELAGRGIRAAAYHAGLRPPRRQEREEQFRQGDLEVVVATIAFGMGIDKPNVRWVYHADVAGSVDEYYQEFGRAGRDGEPAEATLYFRPEDLRLPKMYASRAGPSGASLRAVADAVLRFPQAPGLNALAEQAGLGRRRTSAAAMALAEAGGLTLGADGSISLAGDADGAAVGAGRSVSVARDLDEAVAGAAEIIARRRAIERSRIEAMEAYRETVGCRWKFVLEYFGERAADRCGHCDNDERADDRAAEDDAAPRPFARGSRVRHAVFGEGEVVGYAGPRILLAFDTHGYKRLDVGLVMDGGLLEPAG
ncbi:MAG TPA: RecQ family ATP-dependent DNA helicase [Acidimicrobiales bacterium]|nr:RecQ family ATP-dependent DNA helicase [Acidimicrobiales bacterium]